jgi:ligand-binding sensor domain-containing protein/signal transduction histidine kinase/DNA-binding response OmpR family regulator
MSPNKYKRLLFCLLTLAPFLGLKAQLAVSFSNLTVENGLSQNSVISIAQDSMGFIWLGTRQGLNRYDGYRFKIYKNEAKNPLSISAGEITSLLTDHKGILWVATSMGLNRYDQQADHFQHISGLSSNNIESLYQDYDKNIWVGTLNGLNLLVDGQKNRFKSFYFTKNPKDPINSIYSIFKDKQGNIWIGTGNGLICMNAEKGNFKYRKVSFSNSLPSSYITALASDLKGNLWIGTANGLCMLDHATGSLKVFQHDNKNSNSLIHNDVREIKTDEKGLLWVGTQDGLSILDPEKGTFFNYQHDPEISSTISHNSIHNIFQDRNRNMWIGTYFGGVNLVYPVSTKFKVYQNSRLFQSISGNVLSTVVEDRKHNLWIGTEGGGLNYYNRSSNTFKNYKTNPSDSLSISSNLVKIIRKENQQSDKIIIGTHRGGINLFDPATGIFQHIKNVKDHNGLVGSAEIVALEVDQQGTIWIGSANGLSTLIKKNGVYPLKTSKSYLDTYMHSKSITCIFEDGRDALWIGTSSGLYRYVKNSRMLSFFKKDEGNPNTLQSDYINCITENTAGEVLIGTYFGGMSIYAPKTNRFKTYKEQNGLIGNNVLGIVEDGSKNLWISTANGLSELNPATGRFRNYTKSDGLAGNEFNARSFFRDSRGEIFMGGITGLTSFYPKEIQLNHYASPLVFTGLKLFNQPIEVSGTDGLLNQQIMNTKALVFSHEQNHFTLEFALLNYIKPDKNKYQYKLEGYDKQWISGNLPSATYTNLPAGSYTFILKAVNNDGIPAAESSRIEIKIKPAPWASWWAYLLYFILFASILFLTIRYFFVRALLKRTEDLQQMKLRFFTNVSHEIRTPLTLILGPLEALLKNTQNLPEVNKQVIPIKANTDRLLQLVTELLDFRKTETGNLKLHLTKQDIVHFTSEIFNAFKQLAESRNIQYSFDYPSDPLEIWFDRVQMEKVFFNLLSNAFKFTRDNGTVILAIESHAQDLHILIKDNGIGIPEEARDKLFSDFFQVEASGSNHIGSGIGLALSKSIVLAHKGEILIESVPQQEKKDGATCFTVILRKGDSWVDQVGHQISTIPEVSNSIYAAPLPVPDSNLQNQVKKHIKETVLLVEDNPEIRAMLRNFIGANYQLLEAENGQAGWEIAVEQLPDLVICDVMMPVMNGLDLCRNLKTDERTAHIPIILLTARASVVQQVDGLETGADSYVTKPFSVELLQLNVRNLLQSRRNMRRKFSQQINLQPQDVTVNIVDHNFIVKTIQCIEQRITDQSFGVQELAREIGMSQPILYKKIRAITDLSVNDFIKSIRLKKAALFLEEKVHNVSEIAYLVGFNDPKYFSREFKKQYGYTPKAYLGNK